MAKRRDPLPRLNINNAHQPVPAPFFSPALPTSIQHNFHPSFSSNNPLQTPIQAFFTGPPGAPARPTHHAHQASIQLAAAGIHPPAYATPVTGHFPRPSMMLGPGGHPQPSHPYPNRNRRQLSIGGPPKAVLGGPARKVSPMPAAPATPAAATPAPPKVKKMVVNLPKETVPGEDGEDATRPEWARSPLANPPHEYADVPPVDIATAEPYPPDSYRLSMPDIVDVYLPGKLAWDTIKKRTIEEKLEKLGVEPGSGSNIPHIHAPHARAASISSPADPALLLFKLNKLQKAQDASSPGTSLSGSPQPPFAAGPFGLSPSPRFLTNRHGHSMSLAPVSSYQPYSSSPSPFNPFGMNAVLGTDSVGESATSESSFQGSSFQPDPIHAPQGRVPMKFAPPLSAVGVSSSQIDFIRGFGLDVPLESEEEEEEQEDEQARQADESGEEEEEVARDEDQFVGGGENSDVDDNATAAPQSRMHSRHVSKLSAALSLRSVGGNFHSQFASATEATEQQEIQAEEADQSEIDADEEQEMQQNNDVDPVEEWTGSEDLYLGLETSDDESIGEWSNPSDEERARQQRVERRMRRATRRDIDQPRRLPEFPRPPQSALGFHHPHEDDIISNPSEENLPLGARRAEFLGVTTEEYYPDSSANRASQHHPFALPVHSRGPSSPYSIHDPAMAHSRQGSGNGHYGYMNAPAHRPNLSAGLNPHARPFVFGQPLAAPSGSWSQPAEQAPSMPVPVSVSAGSDSSTPLHTRLPSLGKSLNVAAPEFKPGAFSFRLPGAPPMPVAEPAPPPFPEPLLGAPQLPPVESSPFRVQGREKRQRRLSESSEEDENDTMASFKFPLKMETSSPNAHQRRRSRSLSSAQDVERDEEPAKPFTFAGFNAVANNMPWVPKESDAANTSVEEATNDSSTAKGDTSELQEEMSMPMPVPTKQKRAPIPLDFKHPVSSNTVPAGVFKALINSNEERTRRSVRSRVDSREIFEHSRRPSMDDDHVELIAHRNPQRSRLVTDPGDRPTYAADDVFGSVQHNRRRSSLPDTLGDGSETPNRSSPGQLDSIQHLSLHDLESVIAHLLDEKLGDLRHHIMRKEQKTGQDMKATAEEVISLFRAQLQESAMRGLDNSQLDARGDIDFQVLKEIVEEGHANLLNAFQQEIALLVQSKSNGSVISSSSSQDVLPAVQEVGKKTVDAVVEAISELSIRQESMSRNSPVVEYDLIVTKLVNVLSPMVKALHNEPIDYDFLTRELTQSVKPHISQLIDLASDKRETAGLIVERILPHLASLKPVPVDTDAITLKLITEVRRAIAPIDAFEIKEQVADLVVERLDSRLAVRDKASNVDVVAKVAEGVSQLREYVDVIPAAVNELKQGQSAASQMQQSLVETQSQILLSVKELPSKIEPQLEAVKALQHGILEKLNQSPIAGQPDGSILFIKDVVEAISSEQKKLAEQSQLSISDSKSILDKLAALPDSFSLVGKGIENSITEFIASRDSNKRELEELRKLNAEYQVQLTKARGSHGQVRVEKDALVEKLGNVEGDRDRLQAQLKELQSGASAKTTETSALQARNAELEDALAKALARLQSADVATENDQRTITNLELTSKDLSAENQQLKSRVDSLDREVAFAHREKEAASTSLAALQTKYDALVSQQSNWDALNSATEKINLVFNLLENADSEEQKELRHYRDHCKTLEDENAAMQKRFKDIEAKLANSERSSVSLRQTLTQAQQRSEEWERLAKAAQGTTEMLETKLEQAEQTQAQLDEDYQLVKVQLDEKEADGRLQADRAMKLQQQIVALESKCTHLQSELEKLNASRLSTTAPAFRPRTNGAATTNPPPRPDSRTSTVYDGRSEVANRRVSSYTSTARSSAVSSLSGAEPSVRDSMHAPRQWAAAQAPPIHTPVSRYASLAPATPKAKYASPYNSQYARGPSPTPSTVSAVPTQGDDGWWS